MVELHPVAYVVGELEAPGHALADPSRRVQVGGANLETGDTLAELKEPLRFADEADLLAQVVPGEDGLILEADGKRGTFLPQVWEGIPDKSAFMRELVKKACLPPDTRLGRCKVSRYRVAKFHEG